MVDYAEVKAGSIIAVCTDPEHDYDGANITGWFDDSWDFVSSTPCDKSPINIPFKSHVMLLNYDTETQRAYVLYDNFVVSYCIHDDPAANTNYHVSHEDDLILESTWNVDGSQAISSRPPATLSAHGMMIS